MRRISVIVPTCRRAPLLRQALASIRALEGPEFVLEIIVADNGGDDETRAVAEDAGALYVRADKRGGASVGRNAALRVAKGEFVAFLDDDDQWLPTHLRAHLDYLDAHPDVDAVGGQAVLADESMRRTGDAWPLKPHAPGVDLTRRMLSGFFPQIGALVARASVRDAYGYFDEKLIGGEDLDWQLRIARRNKLAFITVESVLFRMRKSGSYDKLQLKRAGYDRLVFLRHALPERRIWSSPRAFLSAYYGTLRHFYVYFTEAAETRAAEGDRDGALRAVWYALCVFPVRATYHLFTRTSLRRAYWSALTMSRYPSRHRFFSVLERLVPFTLALPL